MSKSVIVTLLAALLGLSNLASAKGELFGPILVGQGGGESEYAVVFARQNLPSLLSACLSLRCALTEQDTALLRQFIHRSQADLPQALFKNSASMGSELFHLTAGTEVTFNQDLLWLDEGKSLAYDVPQATVLWLQVLAELPPAIPVTAYATLQKSILSQVSQNIIKAQVGFNSRNTFEALILKRPFTSDHLFVRDGRNNSYDFTPLVTSSELCFSGTGTAIHFNSVRWAWLNPQGDTDLRMGLELILSWHCSDGNHRGRAKLVLAAHAKDLLYEMDPTTAEVFLEGE